MGTGTESLYLRSSVLPIGSLISRSIPTTWLEEVLFAGKRAGKTKRKENVRSANRLNGPEFLSQAGSGQERTFVGWASVQAATKPPGGKNPSGFPLGHQRLIKGIPVSLGRGGCQMNCKLMLRTISIGCLRRAFSEVAKAAFQRPGQSTA